MNFFKANAKKFVTLKYIRDCNKKKFLTFRKIKIIFYKIFVRDNYVL